MTKPFTPRLVSDWEERVSLFLQEAIAQPHREPDVCEELIEYILFLVNSDRRTRKARMAALAEAYDGNALPPKGGPREAI